MNFNRFFSVMRLFFMLYGVGYLCGCGRASAPSSDTLSAELENRYDRLIAVHAAREGLSPELLKAVIWKESRFQAERTGSKGEIGLMQLMPSAVSDWARALKRDVPGASAVREPDLNIAIGAWYLGWCGKRFPEHQASSGDVLRLAIYNAGYGRVRDKWLPKDPRTALKVSDISFPTTRDYIKQILTRKTFYTERHDF